MDKVNFLMALHCHQPVDNLPRVFDEAYKKAYKPFLDALEKHPGIKLSLHYSGSLLDWLVENRPEFLEKVKNLIKKGQVEILTGGYHEPILTMVPPVDAAGQIETFTKTIKKRFDFDARGIWIAERMWSPSVSSILENSNLKYTILDDFHLERAGIKDDRVFGYYSVKGIKDFFVFACVKKLRYAIPFKEALVTINFLKSLAGKPYTRLVTFADDCEKFGLWPHTYSLVYRKRWLDNFFGCLEKENRFINTLTFSEALAETESLGEVDIPSSSYAEMVQWCEGDFENFFKKYPESDLMKKRMLAVSRSIESLRDDTGYSNGSQEVEEAREELYKSQSNCAYWHGIFGGVYLKYLRDGVYKHIIKAENILYNGNGTEDPVEAVSLSEEYGGNIACLRNRHITLFLDPDYGGSLFEIDYRALSKNVMNTMSRRPEPYHKIFAVARKTTISKLQKTAESDTDINLYEAVGAKKNGLTEDLSVYDRYRKSSLFCHIADSKTSFGDFLRSRHVDLREDSSLGAYGYRADREKSRVVIIMERHTKADIGGTLYPVKVEKRIVLEEKPEFSVRFDLENNASRRIEFLFGIELNWSLEDNAFMRNKIKNDISKITIRDKFCGLRIEHSFDKPMNMWSFPLYTINESEKGLGRSFQEISLLFHKRLSLEEKERFSQTVNIKISL
ncbi:MAG: DUF1926 domain-containing protein [Candidatus Omnitrophica bacterium]|nr:DUF1926 domain-containing protein [Candidatus Omnitrophota bacterium]